MKKNKALFIIVSVVLSFCMVCGVAAIAIQAGENPAKENLSSAYMDEFGGNPDVYAKILAMTDCATLQNEFDQAEENLQEPGTPQYRWGLGYMKASDDRMREIGCYETKQMPIEQIIASTAAAAQTQTMIAAPPSATPFINETPTMLPPVTLVPTWTAIPTITPFTITLATLSNDAGSQCTCTEDTYNCGDPLEQVCFNYCNAQGYGDIHRLDNNNNGIACDNP